jgi:hypothetical protein
MDDQQAAPPLQITVEELYELIGRQLVEIRLLRARVAAETQNGGRQNEVQRYSLSKDAERA